MLFKIFSENENVNNNKIEIKEEKKPYFTYKHPEKDFYIEIKDSNINDIFTERHILLLYYRESEIIPCDRLRVNLIFQKLYSFHNIYLVYYNLNIEKIEVDDNYNLCINLLFELKYVIK